MTLFANQTRSHRGPGRQYIAERRLNRARDVERFAECLANSGAATNAVAVCATAQGKTAGWGEQTLREIRKRLGWELTK